MESTTQLEQKKEALQTLSSLIRQRWASALGVTNKGQRDLYEELGYPTQLTFQDFWNRYRRQDIAKGIIDRPVKATWQGPLKVVESDNKDETPFESQFSKLVTSLRLKNKFARLDRLACVGKYAVLLLGFDDTRIETWPVEVAKGKRKLLYVRPVSETHAKIDEWDERPESPRYGLPLIYSVTLTKPGMRSVDTHTDRNSSDKSTYTIRVHHSRILHVVWDKLEDDVEGTPYLESVYNRLIDMDKLVGGSAEMFWRGARPGYAGTTSPDYTMGTEDESELMDQISEYENGLRRILMLEGVELKALAAQISDPTAHVNAQIEMISSVTGIPRRILTGSERGELASTQDKEQFQELIQTRREEFAESEIVRPFIDRMHMYGVLSPSTDYSVGWSDLFALSDKEQADIGKTRTESLVRYSSEPLAEDHVPFDAFAEMFLGLTKEEAELLARYKADMLANDERDGLELEEEEEDDIPPQPEENEDT